MGFIPERLFECAEWWWLAMFYVQLLRSGAWQASCCLHMQVCTLSAECICHVTQPHTHTHMWAHTAHMHKYGRVAQMPSIPRWDLTANARLWTATTVLRRLHRPAHTPTRASLLSYSLQSCSNRPPWIRVLYIAPRDAPLGMHLDAPASIHQTLYTLFNFDLFNVQNPK